MFYVRWRVAFINGSEVNKIWLAHSYYTYHVRSRCQGVEFALLSRCRSRLEFLLCLVKEATQSFCPPALHTDYTRGTRRQQNTHMILPVTWEHHWGAKVQAQGTDILHCLLSVVARAGCRGILALPGWEEEGCSWWTLDVWYDIAPVVPGPHGWLSTCLHSGKMPETYIQVTVTFCQVCTVLVHF